MAEQIGGGIVEVAQAAPTTVGQPIGQVETLAGSVVAIRADGARVELEAGNSVYQGDTLESGPDGAIGIVLADQTTFSMAENGSMVLDEMVYDPGAQEGSLSLSVLQGVFTFVSGEIAKTDSDAMTVATPVATIGIRGTQVAVSYRDGDGLKVVLMEEADGFVGEVVVRNQGGEQILNIADQETTVSSQVVAPTVPEQITLAEIIEIFGAALRALPTEGNSANDYGVEEAAIEEETTEEAATEEAAIEEETTEEAATEEATEEELGEEETAEEVEGALEEFDTAAGGEFVSANLIEEFDNTVLIEDDTYLFGGIIEDDLTITPTVITVDEPTVAVAPPVDNTPPADVGGTYTLGPGNPNFNASGSTASFQITGGTESNTIITGSGNDVLDSGGGNDVLDGGGGNDVLYAGGGDDTVLGGAGDDTLIAGAGGGNDYYDGGADVDTITFTSTSLGVNVDLAVGRRQRRRDWQRHHRRRRERGRWLGQRYSHGRRRRQHLGRRRRQR